MKKRTGMLIAAVVLTTLTACGGKNNAAETAQKEQETTTQASTAQETTASAKESTAQAEKEEKQDASLAPEFFEEIAGLDFWFGSGAGGWFSGMVVEEDGSFACSYHDSEMGEADEEYPNGTLYYADVTGQFTEPERMNDYTYCVRIDSLVYDTEPGEEEIEDGIRYVSTECYGLDDPGDFYFYTPDAPVSELPEDFLEWYGMLEDVSDDGTLSCYGFYNVNTGSGFKSQEPDDEEEWFDEEWTDDDFSRTAGLWRLDGATDTASIWMDGAGGFETYYADGALEESGYLEYVDEYGDGNGRYDMYDKSGNFLNGLYFDADTQFHIGNDDGFVYILDTGDGYDDADADYGYGELVSSASIQGLIRDESKDDFYGGYYYRDMTDDGIVVVVNCCYEEDYNMDQETWEEHVARWAETACGYEIRDFSIESSEELTGRFTYPVDILTWLTGENEDTRQWDAIIVPTDGYSYLYAIGTMADYAEEMSADRNEVFNEMTLEVQ